jgi:hypothetical protein
MFTYPQNNRGCCPKSDSYKQKEACFKVGSDNRVENI